ncbi:MAG: alpha/beta hydrolase [Actinomycetota bacterium]|nr:alpha/beta hydrolase [Actinomycetota bacterium]
MPTVMLPDRQFHYLDEGTGDDPVVLIHAVPLDATMWEPQIQALHGHGRVVAPDLAGFGGSEPFEDPEVPLIEQWADDVIGLISSLGFDHVTLVGASLGADVALAVTRRARDVVGALGLAGLRRPVEPDEERQRLEEADWLAGGGDRQSIIDRFTDEFVGPESTRRSEVVKLARTMMGRTSTPGWVAGLRAMAQRPDPASDLGKLDVPTLLLAGEQDGLAPPDDVRELAAQIPGAGVIEVPDAGHLPNLENPAVFNRALEDLLKGREARRSPGKHSWPASPAGES